MLGLPISNLVVLSGMCFAGLVHTKSKKGNNFHNDDDKQVSIGWDGGKVSQNVFTFFFIPIYFRNCFI